jgi:CHRD domain-containing protein
MRLDKFIGAVLVTALVVVSASQAHAEEFFARLNGNQEVGGVGGGQTGAIRSNGTGTLHLTLDKAAGTAEFTLTYSDVGTTPPGTGTVTQAHIHFGKIHVGGGIVVFFCSNLGNGPAGTQACPSNSGTVTGTFTSASVVAVLGQNISANDFDALVDALESNTAYANVHTTVFTAGEIRGQIRKVRDRDNDGKDHNDNDKSHDDQGRR